jgi:fucose permease
LTVVAVICLLPALFAGLTLSEAFDIGIKPGSLAAIWRDPFLWLAGAAFFLYSPLESTLGIWSGRYLKEIGFSERRTAWLFSAFWLAFLISRLVVALSLAHDSPLRDILQNWLIVLLAVAAGVALGNLAGTRTRFGAAVGLVLLGAFYGPIFPDLVGLLFGHFEQHGTAYGSMFAIGATGNLLLQPVIGGYIRRSSVQRAMWLPMILAIVLALVTLILVLSS